MITAHLKHIIMKKIAYLIAPVILCFLLGFIAGEAQRVALTEWYPHLVKSPLTPPNLAFPIAWGILYLLMGLSIGLVLNSESPQRRSLITLFSLQLLFNFLWSILFFTLQNPLLGFVDILLLDSLVLIYIYKSYQSHRISSILFWPYAGWILFATYLNLYIVLYN